LPKPAPFAQLLTHDSRPGTLTRRRRLERVWHCRGRDLVAIQQWGLEWNNLINMEDQAAQTDDQIAPLPVSIGGK